MIVHEVGITFFNAVIALVSCGAFALFIYILFKETP